MALLEPAVPGGVVIFDHHHLLAGERPTIGRREWLIDRLGILVPDALADQIAWFLAPEHDRRRVIDVGVDPVGIERDDSVADTLKDLGQGGARFGFPQNRA